MHEYDGYQLEKLKSHFNLKFKSKLSEREISSNLEIIQVFESKDGISKPEGPEGYGSTHCKYI